MHGLWHMDDMVGLIYSFLPTPDDRCSFRHAHPSFYRSHAIAKSMSHLRLDSASLPDLVALLTAIPESATITKLDICNGCSTDVIQQLYTSQDLSVAAARQRLQHIQELKIQGLELPNPFPEALHALLPKFRDGGKLVLVGCVFWTEFIGRLQPRPGHAGLHALSLLQCTVRFEPQNRLSQDAVRARSLEFKLGHSTSLGELVIIECNQEIFVCADDQIPVPLPARRLIMNFKYFCQFMKLHSLTLIELDVVGLDDLLQGTPLQTLEIGNFATSVDTREDHLSSHSLETIICHSVSFLGSGNNGPSPSGQLVFPPERLRVRYPSLKRLCIPEFEFAALGDGTDTDKLAQIHSCAQKWAQCFANDVPLVAPIMNLVGCDWEPGFVNQVLGALAPLREGFSQTQVVDLSFMTLGAGSMSALASLFSSVSKVSIYKRISYYDPRGLANLVTDMPALSLIFINTVAFTPPDVTDALLAAHNQSKPLHLRIKACSAVIALLQLRLYAQGVSQVLRGSRQSIKLIPCDFPCYESDTDVSSSSDEEDE